MDLGNIVYIIAFIFYIIYQVIKKKGAQDLPENEGSEPQAPQKGMSFEDLLKEIREAQKPTPPAPKPAPVVIPTRERVSRKREVVLDEEDDEIQRYAGAFETAPKNKYQSYAEKAPIVNEPSTRASYEPNLGKKSNPYAEKLKNPQSVKEALVLSEILNRKHF